MLNQVFGRLTVVAKSAAKLKGELIWVCQCACGAVKNARGSALRGGYIKSCGCLQIESRMTARKTHGMSRTRVYRVWAAMWDRCSNPNTKNFSDYGGRGISVCKRWQEFKYFLADMGEPPAGALLERVNNDKGYRPSNCRWATRAEQNQNKRTTRYLTANGETLPLIEWARRLGIQHSTLRERLDRGWSEQRACTTPPKRHIDV